MPLKLRVTNEAVDGGEPAEYFFEKDRVTIGRASENDLTLPDRKRIVSSKHAEVRRQGETYQLVDLGSKNFTYLRKQRLKANQPYELQAGDVFKMGEFEIEFEPITEAPEPAADETVFAADFRNPFAEPAEHLADALHAIVDAYEGEAPQRRADALEDAFRQVDDLGEHDAVRHVARLLGIEAAGSPASTPEPPSHSPRRAREPEPEPERKPEPEPSPPESAPEPPPQKPPQSAPAPSGVPSVTASDAAVDAVVDTLVASIARIIRIPWQFRHEFIGQTIMQSADTAFLYDGDPDTMKAHLLDPSISDEEREKRLGLVSDAAESMVAHQVAMLNGYKASVMNGADELMDQVDPEAIKAAVVEESAVYKYLPMLSAPAVLERLKAKLYEMKSGDWSVAEQRIFRPAFIKAYLARMTAVRPSSEDTL